jgi:hypothetical protein
MEVCIGRGPQFVRHGIEKVGKDPKGSEQSGRNEMTDARRWIRKWLNTLKTEGFGWLQELATSVINELHDLTWNNSAHQNLFYRPKIA